MVEGHHDASTWYRVSAISQAMRRRKVLLANVTRSKSIALPTIIFLISTLAFLQLPGAGSPGSQSSGKQIEVSVKQLPSPLLEAAKQVTEKLQVPVSYEEPDWIAESDLMRVIDTPDVRGRTPEAIARIDPKIKVPGPGTIEARAVLRAGMDKVQLAGQLLRACLEDHAKHGNPGKFQLVSLNNYGYSIVPTEVLDKSGKWTSAYSPLDARISFPRGKRLLGPTLEMISQAISRSTGKRLDLGIYDLPGIFTIYDVATSDSGADNEVARDVLARTLREMKVEYRPTLMMSWHLMYRIERNRNQAPDLLKFTSHISKNDDGRSEAIYWPEESISR